MIRLPSCVELAADLFRQLGAAAGEHIVESAEPGRQHVTHAVRLLLDRIVELRRIVAERVGDLAATRHDRVGDARGGLLELGDDVAAAQAQVQHQAVAGGAQRVVHLVDAGGNGFVELGAGAGEALGHLLRARRHVLDDGVGFLRKALMDLLELAAHHLLQACGQIGKFVVDVVGLEGKAVGEPLAG